MAETTRSDGQAEHMNLEEYDRLLEAAEAKAADAERRAEEAESRSRDREAETAEAFETWRKRLVEVAADQVAEEASEWHKVVEEKDAEIARLRRRPRKDRRSCTRDSRRPRGEPRRTRDSSSTTWNTSASAPGRCRRAGRTGTASGSSSRTPRNRRRLR